jgi:hypothetical protein
MAGRATEGVADMSCLLGGPHDLANERVRLAPGDASIANAAEPDADVVVMRAQGCSPLRRFGDGAEGVEMVGVSNRSAGRGVQRDGKIALSNQPLAPSRTAALLSCPPSVGRPPHPRLPAKPTPRCANVRSRLNPIIPASAQAICARTDHRYALALPLDKHSTCRTFAVDLHRDCSKSCQ